MLNIVIPMAGRGSRFANAGYSLPKPLIPIHGKPMIELVINNLQPSVDHKFIFLCLREHVEKYQIDQQLLKWAPRAKVISFDHVTEGAACTVLLAKNEIDSDSPLMIANSDQWVDVSIDDYLKKMNNPDCDGLIMTMTAHDPKWSYVRVDKNARIIEVVEKVVVSDEATVGIYNYRRGSDFVRAAEQMIERNLRVNEEFYVAPVYNQLIEEGMNFSYFNVGVELNGMYGLGVPDDLKKFENLSVSRKAIQAAEARA